MEAICQHCLYIFPSSPHEEIWTLPCKDDFAIQMCFNCLKTHAFNCLKCSLYYRSWSTLDKADQ